MNILKLTKQKLKAFIIFFNVRSQIYVPICELSTNSSTSILIVNLKQHGNLSFIFQHEMNMTGKTKTEKN